MRPLRHTTAPPLVADPSGRSGGVDASVKHDSTAIVALPPGPRRARVRLVYHRISQPSPDGPLDFENTIEATVLDFAQRFRVVEVRFDPYQMQASAQRLISRHVKMVEFSQHPGHLTEAGSNLYELIKGRNLVAYPDEPNPAGGERSIAVETARGWRIAKEKQNHKIDVVIALAMSALASVRSLGESNYDSQYLGWSDTPSEVLTTGRRDFYGMRYIS